ncbi:MAG: nitroreductase family protein [Porphyromonas gingivalis]
MKQIPQDFRLIEDFFRTRRSVRKFIDRPVEEEKLMAILEAGRIAPSAHNYQPWHFLVVREEEGRKRLAPCSQQPWFPGAPSISLRLAIIKGHGSEERAIR